MTYITINITSRAKSDPAFDALKLLKYSVQDAEAQLRHGGNAMPYGGHWAPELDKRNIISVDDMGNPKSDFIARHLAWSVLRDGLKVLNDLVVVRSLAHDLRGLYFGINTYFVGQVGAGSLS